MSAIFARLDSAGGAVPVIARVIVGGMMFFHGLDKLNGGVSGFAEGLAEKGVPLELVAAWGVTLLELVGGLMLVAGLLARVIATLMTVELIFAIILFTGANGLIGEDGVGYERDLAYIVGFLVVVLLGPGRPSLDHVLRLERVRPVPARA
ncbi:MAG: DoxX family protein [Pseudonocardiaceae bacterium]